jgi:hypothetical protein
MQEVDFTRPGPEDFEDWSDMEHDGWLDAACEAVLECLVEGDVESTDLNIMALKNRGYCENDVTIVFDYLCSVADGEEEVFPSFKERVVHFLSLYRK